MSTIVERLDVYHASGTLAYRAPLAEIKALVRSGVAEYVKSRRRLYGCKFLDGPSIPKAGTKYSYNHGTETNPQNVWTLRDIPDECRPLFRLSVTDCMRAGA